MVLDIIASLDKLSGGQRLTDTEKLEIFKRIKEFSEISIKELTCDEHGIPYKEIINKELEECGVSKRVTSDITKSAYERLVKNMDSYRS